MNHYNTKKSLEKNVFASVIDVKKTIIIIVNKNELVKYLNKNPHKRVKRQRKKGYIFLETLG